MPSKVEYWKCDKCDQEDHKSELDAICCCWDGLKISKIRNMKLFVTIDGLELSSKLTFLLDLDILGHTITVDIVQCDDGWEEVNIVDCPEWFNDEHYKDNLIDYVECDMQCDMQSEVLNHPDWVCGYWSFLVNPNTTSVVADYKELPKYAVDKSLSSNECPLDPDEYDDGSQEEVTDSGVIGSGDEF